MGTRERKGRTAPPPLQIPGSTPANNPNPNPNLASGSGAIGNVNFCAA